jgi:hypothetical protein
MNKILWFTKFAFLLTLSHILKTSVKSVNPLYFQYLFPLFANRLLYKSRPEYQAYLQWLNVPGNESNNPLLLLARSGGKRATDLLEVFPYPERNAAGNYEFYFFSRELRHLSKETLEKINLMSLGEQLLLVPSSQNEHDTYAIALQTNNSVKVGYCPPYWAENFWQMMENMKQIDLTVVKVNREAPLQFRLLCKWVFDLPEGFQPFLDEDFHEITLSAG